MTPRQLIEALPTIVRIGGFDFQLEKWTIHEVMGNQRYGECSSVEQKIRIQLDMPSRFKAVDTVLHEISHAIYWAYGIDDDDKEERIVCAFGAAWMAVYRDNPWLLKWLQKALA